MIIIILKNMYVLSVMKLIELSGIMKMSSTLLNRFISVYLELRCTEERLR